MNTKQIISLALIIALIIIAATFGPKKTSGETKQQECPASTAEGSYFERGIDKDGRLLCGFAYYDECPHAASYSATSIECQKFDQQYQEQFTENNQIKTEVLDVQIQREGK